jgi:hypothetical protein
VGCTRRRRATSSVVRNSSSTPAPALGRLVSVTCCSAFSLHYLHCQGPDRSPRTTGARARASADPQSLPWRGPTNAANGGAQEPR